MPPAEAWVALFSAFVLWTASVVSVVLWLSAKFRSLERLIYSEANKIMRRNSELEIRLMRVELKVFGFTHTSEKEGEK